jgi:hypothetical protein
MTQFESFSDKAANLPGFVALVDEGSHATGDVWLPGFSDRDIHVVTRNSKSSGSVDKLAIILDESMLGDEYFITHHDESDFLYGDSLNDLSLKFRSQTVRGRDVVAEKALPAPGTALALGNAALQTVASSIDKRILNGGHWSTQRLRADAYDLLKKVLFYTEAVLYGRSSDYPRNRAETVERIGTEDAQAVLNSLQHMPWLGRDHVRTSLQRSKYVIHQVFEQ